MKKMIISLLLVLAIAPSTYAQGALAGATSDGPGIVRFIDSLTPPASNAKVQRAAEIASWITVGVNVAMDAVDAARSTNRPRAYATMVARDAIVTMAIWGIKKSVHRARPCAPECGIDEPDTSFLSGHTAWAFQTIGSNHRALSLSLAVGTGAGRVVGKKHWLTDVLAGAALGWGVSWVR